MQWQERQIGPRKAKLMRKVYEQINLIAKGGMNPIQVAKFLKINLHGLANNYTTKQLTGVIGQLKEFK